MHRPPIYIVHIGQSLDNLSRQFTGQYRNQHDEVQPPVSICLLCQSRQAPSKLMSSLAFISPELWCGKLLMMGSWVVLASLSRR